MGNEFSSLTNEKKKSIKCHLAVNFHCQQALLEVVHDPNYNGLPKNEEELYQFFSKPENIKKIRNLQKKVLKDDQVDLLLPKNQKTFSNKWDVTLICVVIINFTKLPPPTNGWKKELDPTDVTVAAFVVMARHSRNKNNHSTLDSFIDDVKFNDFFIEMRKIVVGLNYTQISKFDDLAIDTIDQALFEKHVASFMENIENSKKEKEIVITEVLRWLKKDNEKSMFIFFRIHLHSILMNLKLGGFHHNYNIFVIAQNYYKGFSTFVFFRKTLLISCQVFICSPFF